MSIRAGVPQQWIAHYQYAAPDGQVIQGAIPATAHDEFGAGSPEDAGGDLRARHPSGIRSPNVMGTPISPGSSSPACCS